MDRLYGRKSFTTKKAVRELLEPYEVTRGAGNRRVRIERLPAHVASELLARLPVLQQADRARAGAPSFAELVEIGLTILGAQLSGYRVTPEDLRERITLNEIAIPHNVLDHQAVERLATRLRDPSVNSVGKDGSVVAKWTRR